MTPANHIHTHTHNRSYVVYANGRDLAKCECALLSYGINLQVYSAKPPAQANAVEIMQTFTQNGIGINVFQPICKHQGDPPSRAFARKLKISFLKFQFETFAFVFVSSVVLNDCCYLGFVSDGWRFVGSTHDFWVQIGFLSASVKSV